VEQAIDKRSSMAAIGNLNDFVKYQMGKGFEGRGGGGPAGTAAELAVGLSIAQQIMQQQGGVVTGAPARAATVAVGSGTPELLSPGDVAQALGVSEGDVQSIIESGELAAKKIGSTYRIKRSALDEYLAK
jgi:excisionase family DNA binding protein